ncbi:MAG: response regulator [Syntrophobacteraceae bacterium]|nr:response regulator [Syntrophobacteraceae bacterium]
MGNILVVDDERSIRLTVKAFLEMDGHSVDTAEEAESAMAVIEGKPIDVVLTDIILPRVSGVDLLRRIRERSAHEQVIMMTGEPTLETASESLRLGAVDYLQKPVGKNEILKTVRNALHVKSLIDLKLHLEEENRKYLDDLERLVEDRTRALRASEAALRRRAEELSVFNRLARKVNECITLDDAVQCGLREIVHAANPDLAVLFLRDGDELLPRGSIPGHFEKEWRPTHPHRVGSCLCGLAAGENKPIYSPGITSDSRCTMEECREAGFQSFAALPLRSGNEVIGVLGIASLEARDFHEQAPFLETLANEMSIGLKKSLLYEQVQQHAMELRESLTRIEEAEAERHALQQHLQRSQKVEALGTLAGGIAHDFNNILGAMIGYAELALMGSPDNPRLRDNLQMVLTAGERARDLVRQILAFSRQSEEERKPIQIGHTVKEVLKFMRASLPATIEIRTSIGPDIGIVMADPVQIHQVLMNLCTNAHHAMREKGGLLEVELASAGLGPECTLIHPALKAGPHVRVTVRDTGQGMDEATMARIFDPYFTTKEKGVGTGLGLAVVHGIVQSHGGVVSVRSEPGKGSTFDLYFPVIQEKMASIARIQEEIPTGHEHILLVDDDQLHMEVVKKTLEHLGYSVESRINSLDALELFRSDPHRFDLVVTDMTMPGMTGDKLALELMRIRNDIPIVLCTGYSEEITEEDAKALGIRAFVMKPVLISRMARAVRDALGDHQAPTTGKAPLSS